MTRVEAVQNCTIKPDIYVLETFFDKMFIHADIDTYVIMKAFSSKGSVFPAAGLRLSSLRLLDKIHRYATLAANFRVASTFCPPIATFTGNMSDTRRWSATEKDVANGLSISVDADKWPNRAKERLIAVLGSPTLTVASGSTWRNPETDEEEERLHLHWRLSNPTRNHRDHLALRTARKLACKLVEGDETLVPISHPLRWAGSVNAKGSVPRLAKIVGQTRNEVDLAEALDLLQSNCRIHHTSQIVSDLHTNVVKTADYLVVASAIEVIPNADLEWKEWKRIGMAIYAATSGSGLTLFHKFSEKSDKYEPSETDEAWAQIKMSPPSSIGAGSLFSLAKEIDPSWRKPSSLTKLTSLEELQVGLGKGDDQYNKDQKDRTPKNRLQPDSSEDNRPLIRLEPGRITEAVDAAEDALIACGGLYQRSSLIVAIGTTPIINADRKEVFAQHIFERGEHALGEDIAAATRVLRFDSRAKDFVVVNPPSWLAKTLRDRIGRYRFPVLTGIINAPTLRPDRSLIRSTGYDQATGLYFDPLATDFPLMSEKPSRAEAKESLALIQNLIAKFPFVSEADRSVALSAILTACIRQSLRTAPMHAFSAPVAGAGKSKLVDLASVIATGREAGVIAQGKSEEEMEKRLGALFRAGDPIVSIDNCEGPLGGEFLCQVLTQTRVKVRILGFSEAPEFSTKTFITATGNGLSVVGDLTRRALISQLDPKMERPELRSFQFDPVSLAKHNRGSYVMAALTILIAYRVAGMPSPAPNLGSFEEWSATVRSALIWLGCADPVDTMERTRTADPRREELSTVFNQWWDTVGSDRVSTSVLVSRANTTKTGGRDELVNPGLHEALLAVAGQSGSISVVRLGQWIGKHVRRVVGDFCIEAPGLISGKATWRLTKQRSSGE